MARQWRIEFTGALYHVLSRGNDRLAIFLSDDDRQLFLNLLGEISDRFNVEVYAYVLMDNHYHLLMKTLTDNLSKSMQWLGTTYTRRFNLNNSRSGHLFQGRFKCILVENDAYLFRLSCYIHRNPLRAGVVKRLADYPWSSYPYYGYKKKPPAWLATETILGQLEAEDRHKAYRLKVQHYSDERGNIWEDIKHGLIYGSQDFVDSIKARFLSNQRDAELPQHNSLFAATDSEEILQSAAQILDVDLESIRTCRRVLADDKDKRDLMIYLLWETGRYTNQKIGSLFGLSYSAISRCVSNLSTRLRSEKRLEKKYRLLKSQIKV